ENWPRVSEEATLSGIDRNLFWGRQFLNPYAFTALEGSADVLRALADELRNSVHA
ncbi:MAG: type II toxin-antitoxin system HipA family toxin, partial [Mesorhizobium sp.]